MEHVPNKSYLNGYNFGPSSRGTQYYQDDRYLAVVCRRYTLPFPRISSNVSSRNLTRVIRLWYKSYKFKCN